MPDTTVITSYIERARKVLQYEQRSNHQDKLVRGGLELFASRWAEEFCAARKEAGLDVRPIYRFMEHMESYRQQDPLQRAANVRAALTILEELEQPGTNGHTEPSSQATTPGRAVEPTSSNGHSRPASPARQARTTRNNGSTPEISRAPQTRPAAQHDGSPAHIETHAPNHPTLASKAPPDLQKAAQPLGAEQAWVENPIHLDRGISTGHASLALLSADVTAVPGVGATMAAKLHSLGIRTVRDLLFYFPRQHLDYSKLTKIADIPFQEVTTTTGLIWDVELKRMNSGRTRTIARISDATGQLYVSWFNQPYLQKQLNAAKGEWLVVTGTKQRFGNKVEFTVRSHELPEQKDVLNTGRVVPVYPLTEGLSAIKLRQYTKWAVDHYAHAVPEHLPAWLRTAGRLMPLPEAITQIHYPEHAQALEHARRRLSFDELFLIQLGMQERRTRWQREAPQGNAFTIDLAKIFLDAEQLLAIPTEATEQPVEDESALSSTLWSTIATDQPFEATLPFRFTDAQRRVTQEIFGDLAKSR